MDTKAKVQTPRPIEPQNHKTNGFGITSFVFGIISILLCWIWLFALLPILGLMLGIFGLKRKEQKKWLCITGIVLSSIALSVSIFFFGVTVYYVSKDQANSKSTKSTQTTQNSAATERGTKPKAISIPKYEVIYTKAGVGIAKLTEYYVLIDAPDLSNGDFKNSIKTIIGELAKKNGSKEFTAKILSDKDVLNYYYNPQLPYPDGLTDTPEQIQANKAYVQTMTNKAETTLIATYTGGFDLINAEASKDDNAYTILWFGAADKNNTIVGKYAGDETWKP